MKELNLKCSIYGELLLNKILEGFNHFYDEIIQFSDDWYISFGLHSKEQRNIFEFGDSLIETLVRD